MACDMDDEEYRKQKETRSKKHKVRKEVLEVKGD